MIQYICDKFETMKQKHKITPAELMNEFIQRQRERFAVGFKRSSIAHKSKKKYSRSDNKKIARDGTV